MNVLLIHQAFAGPNDPGGTRHFELGRVLVKRGHNFTIIASPISYLTGKPHAISREQGEEICEGVRVVRSYLYPSLHRSFIWRVISFLTFMFSSVWKGLRIEKADLVMGTTPPIFQALSAWLVALLRRRPFLLEVRDLWPEFAIGMKVLTNPGLIWLSRALESFLYARANHILVNSPAYRDYLLRRGLRPDKVSVISNGVDPDMFDPNARGERLRREFGVDSFLVVYAGALGLANDISTLLRAAAELRERSDIRFILLGDGKERRNLEQEARSLGLSNVTFAGSRPKSEMKEVLAASDACVAILQDIPMFRTTYPNKVFDYMAAGRPVILAIDGVIREVVEAAGGGVFVTPGDHKNLAREIAALSLNPARARQMGLAAREYVIEHFDRRIQAEQFVTLVASFSASAPRARQQAFYNRVGKRVLDLAIALPMLLFALPLFAVITIWIRLDSPGPILFSQERLGQGGRVFRLYKFRTMTTRVRTEHREVFGTNEELTGAGRFLRRFKLDELPQLLNVVKGDLSLVGPRPPLPQQLHEYDNETRLRLLVRPGLTGLAQINGNIHLSWPERWKYDVQYARSVSLPLDLSILRRTIAVILRGEHKFVRPPQRSASEITE